MKFSLLEVPLQAIIRDSSLQRCDVGDWEFVPGTVTKSEQFV